LQGLLRQFDGLNSHLSNLQGNSNSSEEIADKIKMLDDDLN